MNSLYQSNIQPLQGCDIQIIVDRGFTPTVINIVPLRGRFKLKSYASVVNLNFKYKYGKTGKGIGVFQKQV
jgi:hypothetical protein